MLIAIINQYFPPDRSATAAYFKELAEYFTDQGHTVHVVSGRPFYRTRTRLRWKLVSREAKGKLNVDRVGSTTFSLTSNFGRALNYLSYLVGAVIWTRLKVRPDLFLVGSDPPLSVLVPMLARRKGPIIYSLQDLHPDLGLASGWIRQGPVARLWDRIHVFAMRGSDSVVCLSDDMKRRLINKGISKERVRVIPYGCTRVSDETVSQNLVNKLRGGRDFVIIHAGNLGWAGPWQTISRAIEILGGLNPFVFVGEGSHEAEILMAGADVHPFTDDVASIMRAGDLQLVGMRTEALGLVEPSKVYTILSHGRPIFAVVPKDSFLGRLVRDHQCGVVASPDSPEEIVEGVLRLSRSPDDLAHMAKNAEALAASMARERYFESYLELIAKVNDRIRNN